MGDFKQWMEASDDDVMGMIQRSPQMPQKTPEQWRSYADRWGVQGEFIKTELPVKTIIKLIDDHHCQMSQLSPMEIERKMGLKAYNTVVITKVNGGRYPLAILDGSHSLMAAYRNNVTTIPVFISEAAAKYIGLK